MSDRQPIKRGDAQRHDQLVEDVLQAEGAREAGLVVVGLAVLALADDDPCRLLQLAGEPEVVEQVVEGVWLSVHVLEHQDLATRIYLPRRAEGGADKSQAAPAQLTPP